MSVWKRKQQLFHKRNGVIKYLALLPQKNEVNSVTEVNKDDDGHPLPGEAAAVDEFREIESSDLLDEDWRDESGETIRGFASRCWIHTHPRHKAFMSPTDIIQLYSLNQKYSNLFVIVISPRGEGLKLLCFRLIKYLMPSSF